MNNREETARRFLNWIADSRNEKEMKKALAKNITYNSDIFNDIYQDSIVKVYNSIMNGNEVKDFKNYMYITLKFNYIQKDNQIKNRKKIEVSLTDNKQIDVIDNSDLEFEEFKDNSIKNAMNDLKDILLSNFSYQEISLFFKYLRLKEIRYNIGYKELSEMTGTTIKYVSNLIPRMKKWIRENEHAIMIKEKLIEDGLY